MSTQKEIGTCVNKVVQSQNLLNTLNRSNFQLSQEYGYEYDSELFGILDTILEEVKASLKNVLLFRNEENKNLVEA